ncbi:MAG: OprO/OprP family phosphate-selective porin [Gemmatimonadota bacterium]|nr:OprO/OprP family phosphate-selective porin [Gemmatimonadota bacterium]
MTRTIRVLGTGAILAGSLAIPGQISGQTEISARSATVRLGGRLHTQLATSSAESGKSFDFFNRRARLTVDVVVNDFLDARVQPDFGGGGIDLKDAYFRMSFTPAFRLSFGQFKRSFDLFELDSSTDMVVVERTGRISGVGDCTGVGGVCSLSRFTEALAYSDRDAGIKIDGSLDRGISYEVTLTNGTGTRGADENSGKSFAGRLSFEVSEGVVFSGNLSHHDYPQGDETGRATAFGADLDIGDFRDGTHFQFGVIAGENWLAEDPATGDGPTFVTAQAILSHYVPLSGSEGRFEAVEPVARVSWGDPDTDGVSDGGVLFTPGVFLYVLGRNRIGASMDIYSPQTGDTEFGLKIQTFLYY